MVIKDDFSTSSLKMLVSAISLGVIFPVVEHTSDVALYVTVCVYVLGKFVDLVSKVSQRQLIMFYIIYIGGIAVGVLTLAMCFYGFATIVETGSNSLTFNFILVGLCALYCFIDVADFVYSIFLNVYTRRLLHQFD